MPAPIMDVYAPPPIDIERGEGVRLFTKDGSSYLDFIAGISVNALGHAHPKLVKALARSSSADVGASSSPTRPMPQL